jgi:dolichol kinase
VEGTLASIASQILLLLLLCSFKLLQMNSLKIATAGFGIIVNALVESKTDQVDNLILPLITFFIFSTAR